MDASTYPVFLQLSFPPFTAALTHEELIQACRESHGSPAMRACTGGQRNAEQAAACRDTPSAFAKDPIALSPLW